MTTRRHGWTGVVILVVALAGAALVRLLVHRDVDGALTWGWPGLDIGRFRLTALGVAATAGAALAVSGVILQNLLRNPLASPFILGLSSGAALGVMVAMYLAVAFGIQWSEGGQSIPALIGAIAALAIVYFLGQRRGWVDPLSILLVGVIVSTMCASLVICLQHLVPHGLRGDLVTWMTGHVHQGVGATRLIVSAVLTIVAIAVAVGLGRAMDVAMLSDDEARSVGLGVRELRLVQFALAGVLTSTAVALTGPIGFVGLVAPHAARLILGPRHRPLVIGAAAMGAILLVGADVASQTLPVRGGRMPVGVFTALLGGPAFIVLLRSGAGRGRW